MTKSRIEWCDRVWNPVTGCTKCSPACDHCYAARMAKRLKGMGLETYKGGFNVTIHPERVCDPLDWHKPCKIFVDSMGDLFHEDVPEYFIDDVFTTMAVCWEHTFMVLTKRIQIMQAYLRNKYPAPISIPENIWIGGSAWSQGSFDFAVDLLRPRSPHVLFVSLEPLLRPVRITEGVDWVIVGAETGPGHRECKVEWVEDIVRDCEELNTPVFVKQIYRDGKKIKMPEIMGKVRAEFPKGENNDV